MWFRLGCDLESHPAEKIFDYDGFCCEKGGRELAPEFERSF